MELFFSNEGFFPGLFSNFTTYNAGVISVLIEIVAIRSRYFVFWLMVFTFKSHVTFCDPAPEIVVSAGPRHNLLLINKKAITILPPNFGNRGFLSNKRRIVRSWTWCYDLVAR